MKQQMHCHSGAVFASSPNSRTWSWRYTSSGYLRHGHIHLSSNATRTVVAAGSTIDLATYINTQYAAAIKRYETFPRRKLITERHDAPAAIADVER
ncbi:hypothetical protein [Burkholderia gladioli]|uniref:hypothetical protein n=1 Tax=Burkholderia gladioli TaxID=28095 RepID=UPI001641A58D|nr:hypothetical protein [Burkholderia gladioli]